LFFMSDVENLFKAEHGGNPWSFFKSGKKLIDMSASTNPLVSELKKDVQKLILECCNYLSFYPEPQGESLVRLISKTLKVKEENLFLDNGSVETIYRILGILRPDRVFSVEPAFVEYRKSALSIGAEFIPFLVEFSNGIPLKPDVKELARFLKKRAKKNSVFFLCNPNNPCGWYFRKEELLELVEEFSGIVFIVDEAFVEFIEEESLCPFVSRYKNLLVLRSFTKFYGIAALRLGYLVGPSRVVNSLKKTSPPWRVNLFAQKLAEYLLKNKTFKSKCLEFFKKEKLFLEKGFLSLGIIFSKSVTNYYLIKVDGGRRLWECMLKNGILLRSCNNFLGLNEDYLRVSLKDRESNRRFLEVLERCLKDS